MRSKTSVRQPVIAGASRQRLSELLRTWRRQPRKRSALLFWGLLVLALISDSVILFLGIQLFDNAKTSLAPPAERHIYIPYATNSTLWQPLRHWVVEADGRTQLFESFCRKAVREITGDEHFEERDSVAVTVSWWLDSVADSLKWDDYPCLRCEDAELRSVLYRDKFSPARMSRREQLHGRYVEPRLVSSSVHFQAILDGVRDKGPHLPLSSLERKVVELKGRLTRLQEIGSGSLWQSKHGAELKSATAALRQAYQSESTDLFTAALTDFLDASRQASAGDETSRSERSFAGEAWLNKYEPSGGAVFLSLLGAALFLGAACAGLRRPRWRRAGSLLGFCACLACLVWNSIALLCRVLRDGAPVCNGGQGMLWCALVILGLSLVLSGRGRDNFLGLIGSLLSCGAFLVARSWPLALAEHWPSLPEDVIANPWRQVQVVLLLSAYAMSALTGTIAVLTLARFLQASPTAERVRSLSVLCFRLLRGTIVLLTASLFLEGGRVFEQGLAGNVPMRNSVFLLLGCGVLVYARRRGWFPPFAFLACVVFGFTLLALMGQAVLSGAIRNVSMGDMGADEGWLYLVGFVSLSLAAHATLQFYFGKPRLLET